MANVISRVRFLVSAVNHVLVQVDGIVLSTYNNVDFLVDGFLSFSNVSYVNRLVSSNQVNVISRVLDPGLLVVVP